ncbi:hypothetical protein Tco_1110777 [Tanacetum coccineum]|uniref:Uncharacterized protein n=1 Tax=Tanacetum coccineum TaxID=301880 RepID=A0ABQ5IJZ8_9ASTR
MDVKTTVLNGNLDEEVYMKQPEGFVMPSGNEQKSNCKGLSKSTNDDELLWHASPLGRMLPLVRAVKIRLRRKLKASQPLMLLGLKVLQSKPLIRVWRDFGEDEQWLMVLAGKQVVMFNFV